MSLKTAVLSVFFLFLPFSLKAQIVVSSCTVPGTSGGVTSSSWTMTVANSGEMMVVLIGYSGTSLPKLVQYAGVTFSKVTDNLSDPSCALYYSTGVPSGTATVNVTFTASDSFIGGACAFTGVQLSSPTTVSKNASATGANPSIALSNTALGSYIIGETYSDAANETITAVSTNTKIFAIDDSANSQTGGGSYFGPSSGTVSLGWTAASQDFSTCAMNIIQATASTGPSGSVVGVKGAQIRILGGRVLIQ